MAKRKVNKTAMVKDYLAKHPDAGPAEVAKSLQKHKISAAYVSNIKLNLRRNSGEQEVRKQPNPTNRKPDAPVGDNVIAAARFIKGCGGIEEATEAFEVAERVARALQ